MKKLQGTEGESFSARIVSISLPRCFLFSFFSPLLRRQTNTAGSSASFREHFYQRSRDRDVSQTSVNFSAFRPRLLFTRLNFRKPFKRILCVLLSSSIRFYTKWISRKFSAFFKAAGQLFFKVSPPLISFCFQRWSVFNFLEIRLNFFRGSFINEKVSSDSPSFSTTPFLPRKLR